MQVVRYRAIVFGVCLAVMLTAACDAVPPTQNPVVGLTNRQQLTIDPPIATLIEVGESMQLRVSVDGKEGAVDLRGATWRSVDPAVVEVDESGTIRSAGPGVTEVVVNYLGTEAHAMVYSAPKFAGIKLEGVEELPVGDTATFQAYLIDEDGNPKAGPPVN
ncbi:MAG: hypothetical protein OEO23_14135, partial [Gemmatimonadota bacterium]|nr:hypothetical protein [Gemmatimonadota bacterium]